MENFLKVNFNPVSKNKDKYLEVKAELTHVENPRLKRFLNEKITKDVFLLGEAMAQNPKVKPSFFCSEKSMIEQLSEQLGVKIPKASKPLFDNLESFEKALGVIKRCNDFFLIDTKRNGVPVKEALKIVEKAFSKIIKSL